MMIDDGNNECDESVRCTCLNGRFKIIANYGFVYCFAIANFTLLPCDFEEARNWVDWLGGPVHAKQM
jgi:hypothetical protein